MADDQFQIGGGNWWEPSRNRFESRSSSSPSPPSSSSSALTSSTATASFGWPAEIGDLKVAAARSSSMDSASVSATSISMVNFQDTQKLQGPHSSSLLPDPNLQIMGLGLSSQAIDWNQPSSLVVGGGKAESSFRQVLQEDLSSTPNFQQETGMGSSHHQEQWRQKMYSGGSEESSVNRGFSLDQSRFTSHISSGGDGGASFQMDPVAYGSPSTLLLQGLLGPDHSQHQTPPSTFENRPMNYPYHPQSYNNIINSGELLPNSFSKFPQFLRGSPDPPKQPLNNNTTQLHFSNSTPFWNATAAAASINDVRSSFFPSLQPQFPPPTFDEKPKNNTSEVRDLGTAAKKNTSEASSKRPRSETASPLPAFKVRKEKMGDRITALQQLVSPFGKTDTASVLSEAIEYIKFLHEQVGVLSTPYMKSGGASIQHQQNSEKSKDSEGPKQDLRSRGLCLVPVSSTFPVTQETTVDFWTPTFGGTFR